MTYKASDPVSVLTFLSPAELNQVQQLGSTLGDLKNVDEFQWGETDLSAASLDRLTHALSNLSTAAPTPGIELNVILNEFDHSPPPAASPAFVDYKPKKFTRPSVSMPGLLKPSVRCFTFWTGVWGLLGLLLFVPFMIPAATTTVSQENFGMLDFSKYDCRVADRQWRQSKYGGYWTFLVEVPGQDYSFWDPLNALSTWTVTSQNIALTVPCWYGSNSDGSYRRATLFHPQIESVRLSASAWTLWTWSLWPIAATLVTCVVLCTCKRKKTEDYDKSALCDTGTPIWAGYLGWFSLIVSGVTCFWFASGCGDLGDYANENNIIVREHFYSGYYWTSETSADSNNYFVYPVCGAGGISGGSTGLWVVGGIFIGIGLLGSLASIKCLM